MVRAMQRLRERADDEDGFTLIELMVVVMILGILIVMGLPTFIGVRARFQDRAAESDLRNVVLAARILFTDNATFTSANETASGLVQIIPNDCYVAAATASAAAGTTVACASGVGGGSISVASTASQFAAARLSASQSCFVILDAISGTKYGETTPANCTGTWAGTAGNVTATTPAAAGW